jgi:uncharacterized membrane protein YeaQ/YmgE (transglycosylase-associated protein family)
MNITNIIIYLIVAAVIGWVASEIMRDRSSLLINIIVAVLGAFLAGYFLSPIFGVGTINDHVGDIAGRHHRDRDCPSAPPQSMTQPIFVSSAASSRRGAVTHPCSIRRGFIGEHIPGGQNDQ